MTTRALKRGRPPGRKTVPKGTAVWPQAATFGRHLRAARLAAEHSLRTAARVLNVSHAYLGGLERGETTRQPGLPLLSRMAEVYQTDRADLLRLAGVASADGPTPLDVHEQLVRLFDHEALRPVGFEDGDEAHLSARHAGWIVDFAVKLERFMYETSGGAGVSQILTTKIARKARR
jgi:transcriptional regulator with XRE-family HTH domain